MQYGPVTAQDLRRWISDGRADANTQAQLVGTDEWKPLRDFPEFAGIFKSIPTFLPINQPPLSAPEPKAEALRQVNGPANGLVAVAVVNIMLAVLGLITDLVGLSLGTDAGVNVGSTMGLPTWFMAFSGVNAFVVRGIEVAVAIYILYGAVKMKKLENHGLARSVAILALLPCLSPCCIVGVPVGIWGLIVLNQPAVKEQFH